MAEPASPAAKLTMAQPRMVAQARFGLPSPEHHLHALPALLKAEPPG